MTTKTKTFTLAAIALELEVSPKVARAQARRGLFPMKASAPWVFAMKDKRKVESLLRAKIDERESARVEA